MSDRYFIYSNVGGALHVFLQNFLSHIFISRVFFVVSVVEPCMFPFSSLIHEIAIINNDDTGIIAIFVSTGLFSPIFQSIRIVKVTLLHHDLLSWSIDRHFHHWMIVIITLVYFTCQYFELVLHFHPFRLSLVLYFFSLNSSMLSLLSRSNHPPDSPL